MVLLFLWESAQSHGKFFIANNLRVKQAKLSASVNRYSEFIVFFLAAHNVLWTL